MSPSAHPPIGVLLQQAAAAFNAGRLDAADSLCRDLVARAPRNVDVLRLQGRILTRQSRYQDAERVLEQAARLAPRDAEVAFAVGQLRLRQGRYERAVDSFAAAERLDPKHPQARALRAEALRRCGNAEAAIELLGAALDPLSAATLSAAEVDLGRPDRAESILRAVLSDARIGQTDANTRSQLHRRLGEVLEARNACEDALAAYVAAKACLAGPCDLGAIERRVAAIEAFFTPERFAQLPVPTLRTRRPVFIIALPRSGTSLLERQIASHQRASAAGEVDAIQRAVDAMEDPSAPSASYPMVLRGALPRDLDAIVRDYLAATDPYAPPTAERVVDKSVVHWMHAGLIAAAFPDAAMIHLERDPMDTGLSCFDRLLPWAMPWSSTLEHVGTVVGLADRLASHWHRVLPGRMHRVRYEDLVRRPREILGGVLEAIGLDWDDRCLRHEESFARTSEAHRPPPTLSEEQVRRPLSDRSIGRAARFGEALRPMREAYERASGRR
jgi:tetratricopeptide (TPR) repeat protein